MRTNSRGRRWLPALLAGAAAAVVGLACGVLVVGSDRPPQAPTTAAGTAGPAASTAAPFAPSSPQPASGQQTGPAEPVTEPIPGDLYFAEVAGVRLPVSPAVGPRETGDGLARGFARSRAGAALAAAHILVRLHPQVGADVFGPTLTHQVVGPHTDALAGNVQAGYDQLLHQWPVTYGEPAGSLHLSLPGYRIDSYHEDAATVVLLLDVPHGGQSLLGATSLQMRWHAGDWALVAPTDGTFTDTAPAQDISGFVLWEGS